MSAIASLVAVLSFHIIACSTCRRGDEDTFKPSNTPGHGASSALSSRSNIEYAHLPGTRPEHSSWVKTPTLAQELRIREFIARSALLGEVPYRPLPVPELIPNPSQGGERRAVFGSFGRGGRFCCWLDAGKSVPVAQKNVDYVRRFQGMTRQQVRAAVYEILDVEFMDTGETGSLKRTAAERWPWKRCTPARRMELDSQGTSVTSPTSRGPLGGALGKLCASATGAFGAAVTSGLAEPSGIEDDVTDKLAKIGI
ncbi:hypothetical protein B0T21DRAFT_409039 [Apiosordaria backusii]|uniref:Uncharacterized protein n=1 Tax=Apiosordaria backusii TaxID=314023 RepID=A0AA40K1G3_9PEZI|nr:hypothetical protein B0T21DRAFT_409039 [Apiosordaria backusii]